MIYQRKRYYGLTAILLTVVFIFGCSGNVFSRAESIGADRIVYTPEIDSLLNKHDLSQNGFSIEPDSAIAYTAMALEAAQNKYGFGSREYVDIFCDYMIPDCMDDINLLTEYAYPIVTTRFCPDSLYVSAAYYELGRILSDKNEFSKADRLFSMAAERMENLEDSLYVEIERAINRQRETQGALYYTLWPLIFKAESLESPARESILFKIYRLLSQHYVRLYAPGYPDSPMGFIDKALEYFDYAEVSDKMFLLYDRYKLLLHQDHREAIKCIDRMLGIFDTETSEEYLDWHILAYITRGDYCANENLDYMGAIIYYRAANELLSDQSHRGIKVKRVLLRRMQLILRSFGLLDEACQSGEILANICLNHSADETSMRYVLELCKTYLSAGKYNKLKNLLSLVRENTRRYNTLAYDYAVIESNLAMHESDYKKALNVLKSVGYINLPPSKKLWIFKNLLTASSHCSPQEAPAYADKVNHILFSEVYDKILHISPSSRRNWQNVCNETMDTYIEVANRVNCIAPRMLELSLFRKGLLFRTSNEISKIVSKDPATVSNWQMLVSLRDSINHHTNSGNAAYARHFTAMADTIEWGLTYTILNDGKVSNMMIPSADTILENMATDDVAIDFISADIGNKTAYGAIILKNDRKPVYQPLFEVGDSIDYDSVFKSFWAEIKPYLNDRGNIYFCPDGILNSVGIEFMKDEDGVPMSRKYNLHRVFHLADIQNADNIGSHVVAVGVSDHNSPIGRGKTIDRGTMTDLPNVSYEMKLIRLYVNPDCFTMLFNDDATEDNFKRLDGENISSLHISTHGIYRNRESLSASASNPDDDDHHIARRMLSANKESLSALILRRGNLSWRSDRIMEDNDDILTSDEIENMSFPNLQLTVLSACDSGLGDIDSEGVWGLQRAFRIAGSKSLICSLRKIDDYWSAQFMDAFYEYAGQGRTIYDSFHHAQSVLYEAEPNHPEIWSSFILIE